MNEDEADLESLLAMLRPKATDRVRKAGWAEWQKTIYQGAWDSGQWEDYGFSEPITIDPNFVIVEQI